ncbi:unnamed protein product (macronuclear) [Paramecium tetraurelia]|uniref:DNA-directed RNA polymerase III subunit RPC3 winged-helix domain-containing protein n=1 Tax=Paramecium tetraurelia TaxID=5888 RepID=A0CQK0_PARTE|nr:uncharacterized protein GSPATT00009415001 [Paramecium tetraurelia]CAK73067.1 unnamed protein product [Paramecium tetraurelia]|eukprot:XP_001440464.1 hypothetical protein (macronuclear) [Paramecium tetraurelia strain d4-2]
MGMVIEVLDLYGPLQYQDILKYAQFDDLKFLEIVITLGIKHQIIGYKIKKQLDNTVEIKQLFQGNKDEKQQNESNQTKNKQKKKGLIFVNHIALLGREYVPELLNSEKKYNAIFDYAIKNGVFGIKNLVSESINESDLETLVNELFDKSLLQIVQVDQQEEIQEVIYKDTKNKSDKKTQKAKKKLEISSQKQQSLTQNSLLQINWTGLMDIVKNNTIMQQLKQIYGISSFQDQNLYKQKQKELKENLEIKWIEDKHSQKHSRVFNLLKLKNCPLDEKQICDLALLNYQDSNTILLELLTDQLIKTQILKENDKDKQRFQFDQKMVDEKLQLHFYKGLISCKDKKLYFGILNQMNLMQFDMRH